ncbi:MAG: YggT family protein [Candidatus Omnitrophota bacterium]
MFILANFLIAMAKIISFVLSIYSYIIVFRALISWVNPDPYNTIVQFLYKSTEPILEPIRRLFRMQFWAFDISPVIAILAIWFLQNFLVNTIIDLAIKLK